MPTKSSSHHTPKMLVDITTDIIETSTVADSSHCMIAEAIRASYPNLSFISVDLQTIRASDQTAGFRYIYLTPRQAQIAIVKFDSGIKPKPFKFKLQGGQVIPTTAKRRKQTVEQAISHKTEAQLKSILNARRLSPKYRTSINNGSIPEVLGGNSPPLQKIPNNTKTPFSRRRQFGLRALDRIPE